MYYVCYARHVSVVTEQALLVRFAHICGCLIQHPSGDEEIRTLDPLLARQVLSQLSYTPTPSRSGVASSSYLRLPFARPSKLNNN